MLIRKDDRVSTVLRDDASLIEVFVSLSPAFERLRNRAMRKVMSRLVTVEQAARMAGVDPDRLVDRLNARGPSGEGDAPAAHAASAAPAASAGRAAPGRGPRASTAEEWELPASLHRIPPEDVVELDVRQDLRNGQEPFSRIMAARREVPPGGALRLRAIFEPVPLYAVMEKQGLTHHTEQLGPEDWQVWFYEQAAAAAPPAGPDPGDAAHPPEDGPGTQPDDDPVILDVRGLEPPEPLVRTLEALEELPRHGTLVQINVRVPQFLLPRLEERGFAYEIREQAPDLVRVFIRRAST